MVRTLDSEQAKAMALEARNATAHSIQKVFDLTSDTEQLDLLSIDEVQSRFDHLQNQWARFCENHAGLMAKSTQEKTKMWHQLRYDSVEQNYLAACASLNGRLRQLNQEQNSYIENNDDEHSEAEIIANQEHQQRLLSSRDQMPMPIQPMYYPYKNSQRIENTWGHFDGNLIHWQGFIDRFVSEVHNNNTIANSYKFILLRDSLTGKAAAALGEWSSSDENYPEAFARVNQLFNRKYQTVHELLKKFRELPQLERASSYKLQELSNITHEVVRQLKSLKCPIVHCDFVFVHDLHNKLDVETQRAWELQRKTESPTLEQMLEFIDWQAKALSCFQSNDRKEQKENKNGRKRPFPGKSDSSNEKRYKPNSDKSEPSRNADRNKCKMCKENHRLYRCKKFLKLNLQNRRKVVKDNELCNNCLKPGHFGKDCYADACKRCNIKHNSAICPENPEVRAINTVQLNKKPKGKKQEKNSNAKKDDQKE